MQSLQRAIRRGNAVISYNHCTMKNEVVYKKGTEKKVWKHALRNQTENLKQYEKN